jgi:hypothetical protein
MGEPTRASDNALWRVVALLLALSRFNHSPNNEYIIFWVSRAYSQVSK